MKRLLYLIWIILALIILTSSYTAVSHDGPVDANRCHYQMVNGVPVLHCH